MSRIAAVMLMLMPVPSAAAPDPLPTLTARQALAASRAATSIGPDPCRKGASEGEIVVCGQRESPYALPGYDPLSRYSADSQAGGSRTAMTRELKAASGACASAAAFCTPPAAVNLFQAVPVIIKGIKKLIEGD